MKGIRASDDEFNTHDTGYHEGDAVLVLDEGVQVKGIVRGIQAKGPKLDVHIGHPGHKNNGRVVTLGLDDVEPITKQSRVATKREEQSSSAKA